MDRRRVFFEELSALAENDENIMILIDDVGYSFFERFQERFPKQFINCGIMEQTITGIAAGLAIEGRRPYVYSMINFVIMRPYEQLRNDICYQNLNVVLVGVKGKDSYKFYGESHNIEKDEDVKILSHLPNLEIFLPTTLEEVKDVVQKTYNRKGPSYIRL